ncbi:MAG: CPXCG motif-containing cysteine-rich protein [Verrucomicrobia bacterium]|nr:CPXCG motif-containing cysteine-rich protein [Verrucomicrobiota bacterium]
MVSIRLELAESIQCPFCGQRFELTVDTSIPSQRFTTDCEVCCRPFEVVLECEPGAILSLDVSAD